MNESDSLTLKVKINTSIVRRINPRSRSRVEEWFIETLGSRKRI